MPTHDIDPCEETKNQETTQLSPDVMKAIEELALELFPHSPSVKVSSIGELLSYHEAKRQGLITGVKHVLESGNILSLAGYHRYEEVQRLTDALKSIRNHSENILGFEKTGMISKIINQAIEPTCKVK